MSVAVVYDDPGYTGGAELTMGEFASASPDPLVELEEADTVVFGNCVRVGPETTGKLRGKKVIRYHHDLSRFEHPQLREWLDRNATHVFTSPLHQEHYGLEGVWPNIPPQIDLDRFRPNRQVRRHTERQGACSVASWRGPGKGANLLAEIAEELGGVDCYGPGDFKPSGAKHVEDCGEVSYAELPQILWRYETFCYLPWVVEPFGRCVVEAWAAGCAVVTNEMVGARHFIENDPEALENAAQRFWEVVV